MGHLDTVNVDPKKWQHGPFSADRDGGYIYGRGTVDDKDNLTAALMVMLQLKRGNVPLDRDVIFLAESGEEGATRIGIEFVIDDHFSAIDAEFCYAEGGSVTRQNGAVRYAQIQTTEKVPNGIDLVARGVAGHGSVPLQTNAIAHLSKAVAAVAEWQPPITLNDTTAQPTSSAWPASRRPSRRAHYRNVVSGNSKLMAESDAWLRANEPRHASMLRTSVSPNIIQGGYRNNVIPSEARATLDVRMIPDENPERFLAQLKTVVNDPSIEVVFNGWPPTLTRRVAQRRQLTHRLRGLQGGRSRDHEALPDDHAADDEHRRVATWRSCARRACSATASVRPPTSRTGPRASAPTAIRSGSSKRSSTASCATTGTSSTSWRAPGNAPGRDPWPRLQPASPPPCPRRASPRSCATGATPATAPRPPWR